MHPFIAYVSLLFSFMQPYIIRSSGNIGNIKEWLRMQFFIMTGSLQDNQIVVLNSVDALFSSVLTCVESCPAL